MAKQKPDVPVEYGMVRLLKSTHKKLQLMALSKDISINSLIEELLEAGDFQTAGLDLLERLSK